MGVLFTLTDSIKAIAQQAFDDLITEVGKDCLLIYPPKMVPCSCSGATGITGGPSSIPNLCFLCNGTNLVEQQYTETIRMGVATDPKHFYKPFPRSFQIQAGSIQTKCYLGDAVKIRQAREMQVGIALDNFTRPRYKLDSEPEDVSSIIQGRYVISFWTRIQ